MSTSKIVIHGAGSYEQLRVESHPAPALTS
jgi:hypothetical protein